MGHTRSTTWILPSTHCYTSCLQATHPLPLHQAPFIPLCCLGVQTGSLPLLHCQHNPYLPAPEHGHCPNKPSVPHAASLPCPLGQRQAVAAGGEREDPGDSGCYWREGGTGAIWGAGESLGGHVLASHGQQAARGPPAGQQCSRLEHTVFSQLMNSYAL